MEEKQILRESKLVRISSRDRDGDSQGQYNFKVSFNDYFLNNVRRVLVKEIVVPNTAYNVNSNTNTLVYEAAAGDQTITVTPGQYTLTELLDELVTQFAAETPAQTMTYTVNSITDKLNITFTNSISLKGSALGTTMSYLLGLNPSINTASQLSHDLPNSFDMSGLKTIHVGSHRLTTGTSMSSSDKSHVKIFTSIPITVGYGQWEKRIITEYHTSDQITHSVPFNISNIDITLYDENLNIVDLNGLDVYITLIALKD